MFQYSFDIGWSDEDDGYIAVIPEFPGISGYGKTPDEAVKEARTAAEMAVEIMKEDSERPPGPKAVGRPRHNRCD
ncbi:MAG: type II toxin-antitoxin system HicB family antitoxin [Syntrophobacteraceae bacterium]